MSDSLARPAAPRRTRGEFRLAGRVVQPEVNRIVFGGSTTQVEPKVMQVLERLAERAGDVVGKDDLIRDVWNGVFVSDDVLVRAISELRRIFGDEAASPAVVETIRGRGYRLVAPVIYELPPESLHPASVAPHPRQVRAARRGLVGVGLGLGALALAGALATRVGAPRRPQPRFAPLTTLEGNEFDPAVSPDGTRIAFSWDGGHDDGPTDLYVKLVGSEEMLRLTQGDGSARGAVWAPDGSALAYVRRTATACDLVTVSALGGTPRRLAPCGTNARFSWSPDGNTLAISHRSEGQRSRIVLVGRDGTQRARLTGSEPGDYIDADPSFSPDGRSVAFVRWITDNVGDLHVVAVDGGAARRLTFDNADIMGFTWIDAGRKLICSSNRAGMYSLWSVAIAGGEPELVAGGGRKIKHPSASKSGDLVAYEAWNYDMNLWSAAAPFDAAHGTSLAAASDEWTFEPRLSPDAARIAFTSTRSGTYEIWLSDADGANALRLTSFGGPYVGAPAWSPDGRRVAFVARPTGQADIFEVDVEGGAPRRLTRDDGDEVAPSYSVDGRSLYFASRRTGAWQVFRSLLGEDRAVAVTTDGGFAAVESRDGRWLYHTRNDRAGLWRSPVAGGPVELVAQEPLPEDAGSIGALDGGVFWLRRGRENTPTAAITWNEATRSASLLASLPDVAWPGVDVSRDARRVLYSRLGRHDSNIVVMSFRSRR